MRKIMFEDVYQVNKSQSYRVTGQKDFTEI